MRKMISWAGFALLMFGVNVQSAQGQSITYSVSSSGSTLLTHITILTPGCYQPQTTTVSRTGNQFTLSTDFVFRVCISPPPGGTPPVVATADLGFLPAGQYQVSWATVLPSGSPTLPATTGQFTVVEDQFLTAIPTVSAMPLAVLAVSLAVAGLLRLRNRS